MIPSASIAHRVPGRIRIRIPSARADSEFLEKARAALASLPGVLEVTCNPLTGSLLVLHSPDIELQLEGGGTSHNGTTLPFVLQPATTPSSAKSHKARGKRRRQSLLAHAVAETVTDVDDVVREATGNAVDLKILLPIVATVLAFAFSGRRARTTPVWLTLAMFAFSSFLSLHGPQGEPVEEAVAELAEEAASE